MGQLLGTPNLLWHLQGIRGRKKIKLKLRSNISNRKTGFDHISKQSECLIYLLKKITSGRLVYKVFFFYTKFYSIFQVIF